MNQSFYTAAVGAWQQQERLNVHGNNIANVNNYGFKAKKPSFAALMYDFIAGAQADELPRGTGTYMVGADTDSGSTGFADTGLDLDYAIEGHGFFALWDPSSGEYSYTRDGSFTKAEFYVEGAVDPDTGEPTQEAKWYLSDGDGRFVMGRDGRLIELTEENVKSEYQRDAACGAQPFCACREKRAAPDGAGKAGEGLSGALQHRFGP